MYENKKRKSDEISFIEQVSDYIPVAIHFAEDCLLTKNGELLKIIRIDGINSKNISKQLFQLKTILNQAFSEAINDNSYAVWLHTFRTKANLDDDTKYEKFLSSNIHELWAEKNYWRNKYTNILYITVLYTHAEIKVKNFDSFTNSLFPNVISNFQDEYLDQAFIKLSNTVEKIFNSLQAFSPQKLSIKLEDNNYVSELLTLYHSIIGVKHINNLVVPNDASDYLAEQLYAVGYNFINITEKQGNSKLSTIVSLKEYHQVSEEALDKILQLPLDFIITEIFYLIDRELIAPLFSEQAKFLNVTNDKNLAKANGIEEIYSDSSAKFCQQQIMVCVVGENNEKLESNTRLLSNSLSKLGIMHVREDISLINTFWSQLPGNFSYIHRTKPNLLKYVGAFSLLHYFPLGNQYNIWGRAITLFRTIKGTPYFFGFHIDDQGGNTSIIGEVNKGKTVLTNFLLSESTKFDPKIMYLATNDDSQIFIESLGGKWLTVEKNIINPLLLSDNADNHIFLLDFFKIILNHYQEPLNETELTWLKEFIKKIISLEPDKKSLKTISTDDSLFTNGGERIKEKLNIFNSNAKYTEIFERTENESLVDDSIIGINLEKLTETYYTKNNLPEDKRYLIQFNQDLHVNNNVRVAIIFTLFYLHNNSNNNHKIMAMDNALSLLSAEYNEIITKIYKTTAVANNVILANLQLKILLSLEEEERLFWFKISNTNIILSLDAQILNLNKKLQITSEEAEKLNNIKNKPRLFLLKQANQSVILELSLGGFIGILKILSAKKSDLDLYHEIKKESNNIEEWLPKLNKAFEEQ